MKVALATRFNQQVVKKMKVRIYLVMTSPNRTFYAGLRFKLRKESVSSDEFFDAYG